MLKTELWINVSQSKTNLSLSSPAGDQAHWHEGQTESFFAILSLFCLGKNLWRALGSKLYQRGYIISPIHITWCYKHKSYRRGKNCSNCNRIFEINIKNNFSNKMYHLRAHHLPLVLKNLNYCKVESEIFTHLSYLLVYSAQGHCEQSTDGYLTLIHQLCLSVNLFLILLRICHFPAGLC